MADVDMIVKWVKDCECKDDVPLVPRILLRSPSVSGDEENRMILSLGFDFEPICEQCGSAWIKDYMMCFDMAAGVVFPMHWPVKGEFWGSSFGTRGGRYNIFWCRDEAEKGMLALRSLFPEGKADFGHFVLFGTGGIHGNSNVIEDVEWDIKKRMDVRKGCDLDKEDVFDRITFLVVHPSLCCLRYGNCLPRCLEDIEFLKKLRESSWEVVKKIGI